MRLHQRSRQMSGHWCSLGKMRCREKILLMDEVAWLCGCTLKNPSSPLIDLYVGYYYEYQFVLNLLANPSESNADSRISFWQKVKFSTCWLLCISTWKMISKHLFSKSLQAKVNKHSRLADMSQKLLVMLSFWNFELIQFAEYFWWFDSIRDSKIKFWFDSIRFDLTNGWFDPIRYSKNHDSFDPIINTVFTF